MIGMLLQHPSFSAERVRSVQFILYGASPMPEGVLRLALQHMSHVRFVQAYGQTEMSPVISFLSSEDHVLDGKHAHRLASAGKLATGCEARIVREDGSEADTGQVGEIVARSPGSMLGYWNMPELTGAVLEDGWVRTGDGGYFDEDGYLYIVDRMKDMIITGGENVFSAEVESVISTYPGVAAVAVIGIPSKRWGEAVHAIVVIQPGVELDDAEIVEHCRARIANYKLPRSVEFRTDPLPVSGAGKVLKRELRDPFWEASGKAVN
jgi:acyl-CoA synthetase (AMP-forming)/AMP-acid ligase II